jgi:hypothetical protein
MRKLNSEDWVKFGHRLAKGRLKGRKEDIIARYIEAWRELHGTRPPMENSLPQCFMDDNNHQSEAGTAWFRHNPATAADSQNPAPGLLKGSKSIVDEGPLDSEPSPPSQVPHPLIEHLQKDHFLYNMAYPCPKIEGGFHEGFRSHIQSATCERIQAIFVISPMHCLKKDFKESTAVTSAKISPDDYSNIQQACSSAIYQDKSQPESKCGQISCWMDGWVSNLAEFS